MGTGFELPSFNALAIGVTKFIYVISHVGTVVLECYKDDVESQWKKLKFDLPPFEKRLNRLSPKFARVITFQIPTATQNFITLQLGNLAPTYAKLPTECSLLAFLGSDNSLPQSPLRRFWRTVKRRRFAQECVLWGPENESLHFYPVFPKHEIFGRVAPGLGKFRLKTFFNIGDFISKRP